MSSAALAAAELYLGKATQIPLWDNELLPKKIVSTPFHHVILKQDLQSEALVF